MDERKRVSKNIETLKEKRDKLVDLKESFLALQAQNQQKYSQYEVESTKINESTRFIKDEIEILKEKITRVSKFLKPGKSRISS